MELPIDELRFPNLPEEIMRIVRKVDRDVRRFIEWVDKHPEDPRIQDFRAHVSKPMPYREVIAVFKPLDLPEDARDLDFWITTDNDIPWLLSSAAECNYQ